MFGAFENGAFAVEDTATGEQFSWNRHTYDHARGSAFFCALTPFMRHVRAKPGDVLHFDGGGNAGPTRLTLFKTGTQVRARLGAHGVLRATDSVGCVHPA